jgi:hypothetical protein
VTSDDQTDKLAEGDALHKSPQPRLGHYLTQGATSGTFISFLFVAGQMLFQPNFYNFLFISALPRFLVFGLLVGTFKSFIIWVCSKIFGRRLRVLSRVMLTVPLFGLLIGVWWWQWFSKTPYRPEYYSGISPAATASLQGVRVLRLAVNVSASHVGAEPENLTVAQLKNLVTSKLMDAGIDVVDINSSTAAQATLYVDYFFINNWKQPDFYNSDCRLRLAQEVMLHRDPHIQTEAPTWEYQSRTLSGGGETHSLITEAVDYFVRDYNRANSNSANSSPSPESTEILHLIWRSALLIVSGIVMGIVIGSDLRPLRTLMYGVGTFNGGLTKLAVISGFLLRMWVVFLYMESILVLISILQLNSLPRDKYFALVFIGHSALGIITAFGRFNFVILAVLSLIAISPGIYLLTFEENIHSSVLSIIINHVALWTLFVLTRSDLAHSAFLNIKQELRYYLID